MANGGRIDWTVGFKVDSSGLNTVKKQLTDLYNTTPKSFFSDNSKDYKYVVDKTKYIEVDDYDSLNNKDSLTLITCTNNNQERYIVIAKRV